MGWRKEEILSYKEVRRKELGPFYANAGICVYEPEKRSEYLAEKLNLTMTDHDMIMRVARVSRVEALKMLEDMAVAAFF